MIDRAALQALQAVLTAGSFEAAAGRLHITQSAVSQRIKTLEDRVGTVLIRRSRPPAATEAGRLLLAHAEAVGLLEQALASALDGLADIEAVPVRIAVTADSLATWIIPALARVPGLLFDLVIDDQDHSADLLRAGAVLGAITASPQPVPGCDVLPLGSLRYVGFASPGFAATHFADGVKVESLQRAPAITFNHKDRLQRDWAAQVTGRRVALPTHYIGSSPAITEAARAGLGWAVNPEPMVAPHVADGSLVLLAPEVTLDTPLFWQAPRQMSQALARLTNALRAGIPAQPQQASGGTN